MNNTRQTLVLARALARHVSQTAAKNAEAESVRPKFQQLKQVQQKFGIEDHTPVYLKGGVFDKMLFATTVGVTLVGLGMTLETYYRLAIK